MFSNIYIIYISYIIYILYISYIQYIYHIYIYIYTHTHTYISFSTTFDKGLRKNIKMKKGFPNGSVTRILLPMQDSWVQFLSQEIPTGLGPTNL